MILGAQKSVVETRLGKSSMAGNLLGLTSAGEKAALYSMGAFELVVGYFDDVARYMAVKRRQGPMASLTPTEVAAALALNAPAALWTSEPGDAALPPVKTPAKKPTASRRLPKRLPTYFSFVERDPKIKDRVTREILGWQPGEGAYLFFYMPSVEGGLPLLPAEWAVDQKLK